LRVAGKYKKAKKCPFAPLIKQKNTNKIRIKYVKEVHGMKDVKLTVLVDERLKESFFRACKAADTTASREIRLFMRTFIAKNAQADIFTPVKKVR
jgi:hypothetical protein